MIEQIYLTKSKIILTGEKEKTPIDEFHNVDLVQMFNEEIDTCAYTSIQEDFITFLNMMNEKFKQEKIPYMLEIVCPECRSNNTETVENLHAGMVEVRECIICEEKFRVNKLF